MIVENKAVRCPGARHPRDGSGSDTDGKGMTQGGAGRLPKGVAHVVGANVIGSITTFP